jgi:hypothetical protein
MRTRIEFRPVANKAPTLILAASLAANALLLAVVVINDPWPFPFGPSNAPAEARPPAAKPASLMAQSGGQTDAKTWAALKGEDVASFIARLRAAGLPPNVVRAIVKAQLDEKYRGLREHLVGELGPRPYWSRRYGNFDAKTVMGLGVISRQESKDLKDLLGPDDIGNNPPGVAYTQDPTAGLSREKSNRVQAIISDFSDMRGEVIGAANGFLLPEDQEKLQYLQKEQKAEIAAELSPDELFEYQLRTSNAASQLRYSLNGFKPTEAEFRAIFKAQQDFDSQYGSEDEQLTQEQLSERQAHQGDVLAKIQDAIGPDRADDYKQRTNPNYNEVSRLVDRLDLPEAATQQVLAVQGDISKRADAIRKDTSLSAADRSSQLAALADEAASSITTVIGDRGMAFYKNNGGGWIQGLKQPPSN